jgi:hypothetical protein
MKTATTEESYTTITGEVLPDPFYVADGGPVCPSCLAERFTAQQLLDIMMTIRRDMGELLFDSWVSERKRSGKTVTITLQKRLQKEYDGMESALNAVTDALNVLQA